MAGRRWIYYGTDGEAGNRLRYGDGSPARPDHPLLRFSNPGLCLPPHLGEYVAALTRVSFCGYSALAFWDSSRDNRGGAFTVIYAPSLDIPPDAIVAGAQEHLPRIARGWPPINTERAELSPR